MAIAAGTQIGPYKIVGTLGTGGMGEVYRARDPRLDREVAIKVLPEHLAKDPATLSRFEREAKAVAALSHPNILSIHDLGVDQGISYTVTELLEGETLRARIARAAIPSEAALKIAISICEGLAAAHSKGVIHRDLKPENLFLTTDGRVKILDFGLARYTPQVPHHELTSTPTQSPLTEAGMVMGTAPYMSPEQLRGEPVDERTDIFSFGCVLYEMIHGKRAFEGTTSVDIISAILTQDLPKRSESVKSIPSELDSVIRRCVNKTAAERFSSAQELGSALRKIHDEITRPQSGFRKQAAQQIRRPVIAASALVLLALVAFIAIWLFRQRANVQWAREQALPEISRLIEAENYNAAFRLARKAEPFLPNDAMLSKMWPAMSRFVDITTVPEDASIYFKEYKSWKEDWEYVGRSPLKKIRIPIGLFRFKIEKTGFRTSEVSGRSPQFGNSADVATLTFPLDQEGSAPAEMVRVPGAEFSLEMPGLDHLPAVLLDDYWIDRYEVTNQEFKNFVKAGGYQKREYWKHEFIQDKRRLTWEEAMAQFHDSTGRPGPATWEVGDYPKGQEDFPVTGVSWYEAAAYAEYAGKSLPTIYHWNRASGSWDSAYVVPLSNFSGQPTAANSNPAIHRYGTYGMAGNAKEWSWNESQSKRYILGGAWNEPTYMFNDPDAQPPFSRMPTYGFRCVRYLKPVSRTAMEPIPWVTRDYHKEKPVSDEIFQAYKGLYSYDKTPLHPTIESTDDSSGDWKKERITFESAYGNEKVIAYLFLPKNAAPPYQTVIYFPGSGVLYLRSSADLDKDERNRARINFVIQSGRALLYPIYKGTFERGGELKSDYPTPTSQYRDSVISWYKDLARSIDYLETRKDIDAGKLAFFGASWGGAMGLIMPALESRLKASVLLVGGFYLQKTLPEVDQINFVSRVTIPTLMLNGRHDFFLPMDSAQIPAFQLLGTPEKEKRQIFYETGHDIPRTELIRETLNWLDRYLGPVTNK